MKTAAIHKNATSTKGMSISAEEVKECFAEITKSQERSLAFLKAIGVPVSNRNRLHKATER